MTIYTPETTAAILQAMEDVTMANNGYADIGNDDDVRKALVIAGFKVIRTRDLFGRPVNRAFTAHAAECLKAEAAAGSPFAIPTIKPMTPRYDGPDYEAKILARQDAELLG